MDATYEIPLEREQHLKVGTWVEIFEAYGDAANGGPILVKTMRVGSKTLVFSCRDKRSEALRSLRPHEGQIVALDRAGGGTRFRLRLQS